MKVTLPVFFLSVAVSMEMRLHSTIDSTNQLVNQLVMFIMAFQLAIKMQYEKSKSDLELILLLNESCLTQSQLQLAFSGFH